MSEHIVPIKIYLSIWLTLMVLTGVTIWVAYYDLKQFSVIVALSIAVFKALLVVLYFMHVRYSSRLTKVIIAAGVFWLIILIALTFSDYWTRNWQAAF
ncbi:MAG: cytochrome C oxidase subunit IV family protein [Blastocatellia bacterium]|nr:cytochrome C oxidase subunit IV family protein [Blastocatellia bacterium]